MKSPQKIKSYCLELSGDSSRQFCEDFITGSRFQMVRSSRPEVFCKTGVLRNFAKFTGKHLRQSFSLQLF